MVATKRCAWGTCRNDSRFPHLLTKNPKGDEVRFYRFPAPKRWKESAEKRKRWIVATELYYITGGSARGKKVKQKTWQIFA